MFVYGHLDSKLKLWYHTITTSSTALLYYSAKWDRYRIDILCNIYDCITVILISLISQQEKYLFMAIYIHFSGDISKLLRGMLQFNCFLVKIPAEVLVINWFSFLCLGSRKGKKNSCKWFTHQSYHTYLQQIFILDLTVRLSHRY